MAGLSAIFTLKDQMSDALERIAGAGREMTVTMEEAGEAASQALDEIPSSADGVAESIDGVAQSLTEVETAAEDTASAISTVSDNMEQLASQDGWTDAADGFDDAQKAALEACFTLEDLVEMGLKSADAIDALNEQISICEKQEKFLQSATDASVGIQKNLADAVDGTAESIKILTEQESLSVETKEQLQEAAQAAADAQTQLAEAIDYAEWAMQNYKDTMDSGTTNLAELEAAAEQACWAAEELAAANGNATTATENLTQAVSKATDEINDNSDSWKDDANDAYDAISTIAGALGSAGIASQIKSITDSVYDMADAFSEAESSVVLATGATGDALDDLTESMMDVYSASKTGSLSDTATIIGELNTRLGYTGDTLEETAELFLDFSDVTGTSTSSAVRSVTQLMNQWNVDATEMESVLSKLTYAGQASGISVDSLSSYLINNKSILDQLGFSLDEATAMFMQFELAGTQTSSVMMGLRSALSSGEITSMKELYDVFEQIEEGIIDASDAADIFGSRAGPAIVNAVQGGVFELDEFVEALESSDDVLGTTADTAQTMSEKWEQATNNIEAAFTSTLEPVISDVSEGFAGIVNQVGDYLNENPKVTAAISAVGVGLVTAVTGITGVVAAVKVVIPLIKTLTTATTAAGTAISASLGPIALVAAGVTAAAAAILILKESYDEAYEEAQQYSAVTAQQVEELEDLQAQYDALVESGDSETEAAYRLQYQIDDLTESIEQNGKSVSEVVSEMEDLVTAHQEAAEAYSDTLDSIDDEETSNMALIQKLDDLASASTNSADAQAVMQTIIDELNDSVEDLDLTYDDLISNQEESIEKAKEAAQAQADSLKAQQDYERYVELLAEIATNDEAIAAAEEEVAAAQERASEAIDTYTEKYNNYTQNGTNPLGGLTLAWSDEKVAMDAASDELQQYTDALDDLNQVQQEAEDELAALEKSLGLVADETQETAEAIVTLEEAIDEAVTNITTDLDDLCEAYEEAYTAAYESFSGQFDMFDEAEADAEATVEAAQSALDTQLEYWTTFNANLATISNTSAETIGITQENYDRLFEYLESGDEEAAGLAASIAESLEQGNYDAVAALANTMGEIDEQQSEAAETIAEFETDFEESLEEITATMQETIDDLNLEDEAYDAAESTIAGYIEGMLSMEDEAVMTAQEVAAKIAAGLTITASGVTTAEEAETEVGYASGTTNAVDRFIAGEEGHELIVAAHSSGTVAGEPIYLAGESGPELIVGAEGSTVFPTGETDRIIDALTGSRSDASVTTVQDERRIIIEVNGSGSISIGAGTSKDEVVDILTEQLRPVLMEILQEEMYEEGDGTYGY